MQMEAAEYAEFIDRVPIREDDLLLRWCKTPYEVDPEVPEDIVDAGAELYVSVTP